MNREEQIKKAQELLSDGNFEEARSLVEAIKKHDAEHKAEDKKESEDKKEPEVKEQEDKKGPEDKKEPEAVVEPEKVAEKVAEDKKEVKKEKRSFEPKGEEINMEKVVLDGKEITQPETEVRGFLNYVRSHNPKMDLRALPAGVKATDVGAIIPEDIVTKTKTLP